MEFSKRRILLLFASLLVSGCTSLQIFRSDTLTPRERYIAQLRRGELIGSSMAQQWQRAGDPGKQDSIFAVLPFSETGFFSSGHPEARFYEFDGRRGQIITVKAMALSKDNGRLFVDLFRRENGNWKVLSSASDTSLSIRVEMSKDARLLLRLQPELLVSLHYGVTVGTDAALIIPVKGASNKDIGSFYDDVRMVDGKARKHEGVDIFAKKGTSVIAPTDGVVSRVGTNSLGGKVIFLKDSKRPPTYYFAHLDSQMVKPGVTVQQGDILGTVGNTGNAKNTPSHLHFGVFTTTSLDPIAWIRNADQPAALKPDTSFRQQVFRVNKKNSILRAAPSSKALSRGALVPDSYLRTIGSTKDWYRVVTADEKEGFIERSNIQIAVPGNRIVIMKNIALLSDATDSAIPIGNYSGEVRSLASWKNFRYVRTTSGQTGWINFTKIL